MDPLTIGIGSLGLVMFLIAAGVHIAVGLSLTAVISVWLLRGSPDIAFNLLFIAASDAIASYDFAVVPLFVLMGLLVATAGIAQDAYRVVNQLFQKVRGGLGAATVVANAIFAAVTGVSIASAAVFTKIAVPEMRRFGYQARFAVGIVAGSSILGMLIPPSLLMIVFGVLSEVSIGSLFIAGILPGILMTLLFCGLVFARASLQPSIVEQHLKTAAGDPFSQSATAVQEPKLVAKDLLAASWPIVFLVSLVLGGIYGGVFTPTEAGAVGAAGALVVCALRRKLSFESSGNVLVESGKITASICVLVIGATAYSRMLAMTGVPFIIPGWIAEAGLGLNQVLLIYVLMLVVMGLFLDSISIMLLTVPITFPAFLVLGADPVWIGIVTIIAIEIGILTPPLGIALFVVKATLDDPEVSLADVVWGALPFVGAMAVCLGLVIAFPWLATGLL